MAKKYNHISLSQSKRKTLIVNKFGGLDLSSQKFNVSSGRAIEGENFIAKHDILQVREGFEQLYCVSPFLFIERDFVTGYKVEAKVTENPVNFNGIWQFEAEDGNKHIIAHIGYLLYEILNFGTKDMEFQVLSNDNDTDTGLYNGVSKTARLLFKFKNQKSQAFVGDRKLWFLGGNKYMVIRFKPQEEIIQPVEDSDLTFIPRTTIGITYTNAIVAHRAMLDYPNMLTMFRKNMLITGIGKDESVPIQTPYYEYLLDAPLLTKSNNLVNAEPTDEAKRAFSKIRLIIRERGEI